jgi:hypothetical protein
VTTFRTNRNLAQHLRVSLARTFTAHQLIPPEELWFSHFSLNGAGEAHDMNVDGSVTPQLFLCVVPEGKVLLASVVGFHMIDAGITPQGFGGLSELTNGLLFHIHDVGGAVIAPIIDAVPIKRTLDFAHFGLGDLRIGGGADHMTAKLDFLSSVGYVIYMTAGQYFAVHVRDNLTGLMHFEALVTGRLVDA